MTDPVRTHGTDGRVCERSALLHSATLTESAWPLAYTPDDALRAEIEAWRRALGLPKPAQQQQQPPPPAPEFEVDVEADETVNLALVRVRVLPAVAAQPRAPVHFVLVLDVSASMGMPAGSKGESAKVTRLQIVQHAAKTCAAMLSERDTFSVVSFSNSSDVVVYMRAMSESGKQSAYRDIDALAPRDMTHMYIGINTAIRLVQQPSSALFTHIVVLTDGEPNVDPGRGWAAAVREDFAELRHDTIVSTIGFGSDEALNLALLADIAQQGRGHFAFVSDASVVGTTMVHFVAQSLNAGACGVRVSAPFGANFATVPRDSDACALVPLHRVQHAETARVLVGDAEQEVQITQTVGVRLAYESARVAFLALLQQACACPSAHTGASEEAERAKLRADFEELAAEFSESSDARVRRLAEDICAPADESKGQIVRALAQGAWRTWGRKYLVSLMSSHTLRWCTGCKESALQDYRGPGFAALVREGDRAFLALPPLKSGVNQPPHRLRASPTIFNASWGPPSPPSWMSPPPPPVATTLGCSGTQFQIFGAHPGGFHVFSMGAASSDATRSYSDARRSSRAASYAPAPEVAPASIDMTQLSSEGGSCFGPDACVLTARGGLVRVSALRKGDWVWTGEHSDAFACVRLVIEFPAREHALYGTAGATAYHPVRRASTEWAFAKDVLRASGGHGDVDVERVVVTRVWNLVMEPGTSTAAELARPGCWGFGGGRRRASRDNHRVALFDYTHLFNCIAVTLGHGLEKNAVVAHPFFGSRKAVMRALAHLPGFHEGYITMPESLQVVRDARGLVCGWTW